MRQGPLGRRIAHGVLSIGLLSTATTLLTQRLPESVPCVSKGCDVRFRAPVFFGDTLTATAEVTEKRPGRRELLMRVVCTNQLGRVVTEGTWYIKFLPSTPADGKETA
jgi:3-hydroxybutyryl-CoA dehydratase